MDSNARAAVKSYFDAFNEHVVSMNEKLDAYMSLSVELDKQWEERGKSTRWISGMETLPGRMAEVKREMEALEVACGEEVLYDAAHEKAVASLSSELAEIFERMPATDKYDLLVEKYAEKYRQEKLAENDAINTQYKNALEENARLRRGWTGANALSLSDDDVHFAGEQVEIYRRYLGHGSLVEADCRSEAQGIMPIHHPGITGSAIEAESEAYRNLSGDEAVAACQALQRRYVMEYTHHVFWEWQDARNDAVNAYNAFREHGLSKPSFLGNLVSGGEADKKWREEGNDLLRKARDLSREFEELDEARHDARSGGYNEDAMEDAEENIRSVYPELYEKVQARLEEVERENDAKRLESEAQRTVEGREQSGSRGLSR